MNKKFISFFLGLFSFLPLYADFTNGVFILNEGWLGMESGSVNYCSEDGEIQYRVFSNANPMGSGGNYTLGTTTDYGCIYDGKAYFVSKQAYETGGRLVIADARTMRRIASIDDLNGYDGRSFIGVNPKKDYIGTSKGVLVFDIENMRIGNMIAGGNSKQIGLMVKAGERVFAVQEGLGVLVIDATADIIETTITAPYAYSIATDKEGIIWIANSGSGTSSLIKVNPETLTTTTVNLPIGITLYDSWGAWNVTTFCAAHLENALYFSLGGSSRTSGNKIGKYYIDQNTFDTDFYTLPNQEGEFKEEFYSAGFRVNPKNDQLVLISTESGWGEHYKNNWIRFIDGQSGQLLQTIIPEPHYWFQALPIFPEFNKEEEPSSIEKHNVAGIQAYPNPFVDKVYINNTKECNACIYSADGKLVMQSKLHAGKNQIELGHLGKGIYILKAGSQTVKLVK